MSKQNTLKVYRVLMEDGEFSKQNTEIMDAYCAEGVEAELREFGAELGFTLLETASMVYLIPHIDNTFLIEGLSDLRVSHVSEENRKKDRYLYFYIFMLIVSKFFSVTDVTNPVDFLLISDIIEDIDRVSKEFLSREAYTQSIEAPSGIDFASLAQFWTDKILRDDENQNTRGSKEYAVRAVAKFMQNKELIVLRNEETELRLTQRFIDIYAFYYSRQERVKAIHEIFDEMRGQQNADT